jgi:hypothetical protein
MTDNNIVQFPPLRQFANRVATAAECAEIDFEPWPKADYLSGFQASMQNIWVVITHARGMMSGTKSELCTAIEELEQSGELMNMSHSFDNAREALVAFVALIDDATARTVIGVNHYTQMTNSNDVASKEMLWERVLSLLVVGAGVLGGSTVLLIQALPPLLHGFP